MGVCDVRVTEHGKELTIGLVGVGRAADRGMKRNRKEGLKMCH